MGVAAARKRRFLNIMRSVVGCSVSDQIACLERLLAVNTSSYTWGSEELGNSPSISTDSNKCYSPILNVPKSDLVVSEANIYASF